MSETMTNLSSDQLQGRLRELYQVLDKLQGHLVEVESRLATQVDANETLCKRVEVLNEELNLQVKRNQEDRNIMNKNFTLAQRLGEQVEVLERDLTAEQRRCDILRIQYQEMRRAVKIVVSAKAKR